MFRRLLLCASLAFVLGACGSSEDDPDEDDPIVEADAGAQLGDPDSGGTVVDYMEPCDGADVACAEQLVCFQFNSRGQHCTHNCAVDSDCAPPSRGCSNMGVCKAP